jgi:hypothetical protein
MSFHVNVSTKRIVITFLLLWCSTASAVLPSSNPLPLQSVAQKRADYMALHNYRWHPPYNIGQPWRKGARFEGAGWGRQNANPKRIGTCLPRYRGMQLVGDAFARSQYGTYRIRLWR